MDLINAGSTFNGDSSRSNSYHFRRCSLFLAHQDLEIDDSEDGNEMWEKDINVFVDEAIAKENKLQITNALLDEKERTLSLALGFDLDTLGDDDFRRQLKARGSTSKENLQALNDSLAPCSDFNILTNENNHRASFSFGNCIMKHHGDVDQKSKKNLELLNEEDRAHSLALDFDSNALQASHRPSMTFVKAINNELESCDSKPKKKRRHVSKQVELPTKNVSGTAKMIPPSGDYYQTLLNNLITSMERSEKTRIQIQKMKKELEQHKNETFLYKKNKARKRRSGTQFVKHMMYW